MLTDSSLAQNTAGYLDTLYSMREESVAVREESVAVREESVAVREQAIDIREEARDIREEARDIREEAISLISEAYEMRDSTRELEGSLVEAIGLVMEAFHQRNQSELYRQIMDSMARQEMQMTALLEKVGRLEGKVDGFEERAGRIEAKVDNASIEMKMETIANSVEELGEEVRTMGEELGEVKATVEETSERVSELLLVTSGTGGAPLHIVSATAYNYHVGHYGHYVASNAHDGDIDTWYTAQDNNFTTNWIKFYLDGTHNIGTVKITPRQGFLYRIVNTAVYVYQNEAFVAHCGTVTTALSIEYIDCGGSYGDMVYLTDLDTGDCCGLNIAEVEVHQSEFGKIEALSVSESSSWLDRDHLVADMAVDGNIHTQLHTECASDQWFRMDFPGTCRVDRIVLINGKINQGIWRLDQSAVYVIIDESRKVLCGKVQVREGTTFESQTYTLECSVGVLPMVGVGVIVHNHGSNCLEIREFEVYGACAGQV